ncbi:MAG: efflux RND transporter periplasmic adaptor subunit [Candidatus Omnitrophica bacterium]|nr:efflux RND transporter periplasmic adaptor subunit [Candidatus Omnitrophota bacterium]
MAGASKRNIIWIIVVIAAGLFIAGFARKGVQTGKNKGSRDATYRVTRQDIMIDMVESGSLKAKVSTPITAQLERQATILYIVDQGSQVRKGDILVELDKTEVEQMLQQEMISLERMESDVVQKEKDLEIQNIQNEGELSSVTLKVEMAQMEMEKYEKGEGPQKKKEAEANLEKAKRDMQGMPELLEKGFVTQNEFIDAQVGLDRAQTNYDIFMIYTYPKDLKKNKADYEEAKRQLDATKARLDNVIAQKESALSTGRRQLEIQGKRVAKLKKDLDNMTLKAPNDGVVLYGSGNPYDWQSQQIKVGAQIYGRQVIITLPDTSVMQVACKVHEVDVDKIKEGQDADITIDAFPDLKLKGKVEKVGLIATNQGMWGLSDVKVFDVDILLDENNPRLKPGMSVKSTIHVDSVKDAICVPVEAVFEENGKYFCYVMRFGKRVKIGVTLGQNNDNFIEVSDGVREGELVVLSSGEARKESKGVQ